MSEWGGWVLHDGKGCPVNGMYIRVVGETVDGDLFEQEGWCRNIDLTAWDWSNFGKWDDKHNWITSRVLRYRIRKPRGLQILEEQLAEIDAPIQKVTERVE